MGGENLSPDILSLPSQLPYLIDGQTKLTQSNAILRYIARKHKMAGESEEEIQRVDMLENQVMDFRLAFARICYNPDFVSASLLPCGCGSDLECNRWLRRVTWG
ncbi:3-hydroxybutyryl-CoA dehydrogenase [Platysternon megacephalum]|uniref:glutathione transferase n=1 Tax=Platysternon megacephalum TaxID=55544 RepID=A0A4D9DBY2_9SAUR|nr:3-hydroxybutyryl-CoA dehydrogenase [Platysternon megacephalum]